MEQQSQSSPGPWSPRGTSFWVILGVILTVGSLLGANQAILSTDSVHANDTASAKPSLPSGFTPMAFGFVDVPGGVMEGSPRQGGIVFKIHAQENEIVEEGKPLIEFDSTVHRAQLAKAKADELASEIKLRQALEAKKQHALRMEEVKELIKSKDAEAGVARAKWAGLNKLAESSLGPKEDADAAQSAIQALESARAALENRLKALELTDPDNLVALAEADLKAKKATVEEAQWAVDHCTINAEKTGKVLRMLVREGETVSTLRREPMFYFAPDVKRIIRAEVDQEYINYVRKNQTVTITDDLKGSDKVWTGRITHVSDWLSPRRSILFEPGVINDVRTLECLIEVDDPEHHLKIGQRMRITLDN